MVEPSKTSEEDNEEGKTVKEAKEIWKVRKLIGIEFQGHEDEAITIIVGLEKEDARRFSKGKGRAE